MNRFERRVVLRVLGIHVAVVLFLLMQSVLQGCFHPKPPAAIEVGLIVERGRSTSTPAVQEVAQMDEPESPAEETPVEEPTPVEEVAPPVELPVPVPQDVQPERKKDPEPEKKESDWKPVSLDDMKKQMGEAPKKVVNPQPAPQKIDVQGEFSDLTTASSAGNPNANAAYDALIHKVFRNAWARPAAPAMRPAKVTISITSNGRIKSWKLTQSSGDSQYDESVKNAAKKISILPRKPPSGYPLDGITIEFNIH